MADIQPVATLPVDHSRAPTGEKHEGVVAQAKGALTGKRHVTRVEHAQINEAIAQGIAENVDDFMVSYSNLNDKRYSADGHRHSCKRQTKPTSESVG